MKFAILLIAIGCALVCAAVHAYRRRRERQACQFDPRWGGML